MQRQVLEGFDLRGLPAVLFGPADRQHVVGELLAEHQGGRVRLRFTHRAAFDDEVGGLRRRREDREKQTGRSRACNGHK